MVSNPVMGETLGLLFADKFGDKVQVLVALLFELTLLIAEDDSDGEGDD